MKTDTISARTGLPGSHHSAIVRAAALVILWAFAFRRELYEIASIAAENSEWAHAFAAPILATLLVRYRWNNIAPIIQTGSTWGLVALVLASLVWFSVRTLNLYAFVYLFAVWMALISAIWAAVGRRVCGRLWPAWLILLLAIPLSQRPMEKLTHWSQRGSLEVAAFVLDALPNTRVAETNMSLSYYHAGRQSQIGPGERRFAARQLPACMMLTLFTTVVRARKRWQLIALLIGSVPIVLASNCIRLIVRGLVAIYGQYGIASTVPRNVSIAAALIASVSLVVLAAYVLNRLLIDEPADDGADTDLGPMTRDGAT